LLSILSCEIRRPIWLLILQQLSLSILSCEISSCHTLSHLLEHRVAFQFSLARSGAEICQAGVYNHKTFNSLLRDQDRAEPRVVWAYGHFQFSLARSAAITAPDIDKRFVFQFSLARSADELLTTGEAYIAFNSLLRDQKLADIEPAWRPLLLSILSCEISCNYVRRTIKIESFQFSLARSAKFSKCIKNRIFACFQFSLARSAWNPTPQSGMPCAFNSLLRDQGR